MAAETHLESFLERAQIRRLVVFVVQVFVELREQIANVVDSAGGAMREILRRTEGASEGTQTA